MAHQPRLRGVASRRAGSKAGVGCRPQTSNVTQKCIAIKMSSTITLVLLSLSGLFYLEPFSYRVWVISNNLAT